VTTRERLEGIIHKMRIGVLANIGGDERPSWIQVLAVASNDVVLDIVEIWLTASDTAWPWFAEQILHALGDEERDNKGQSKTGPAFLPLPELAGDHSLSRKTTCGSRTWYQCRHDEEDDDCRNDQSDDRQQADGNLFVDYRVGDAQVQQRERPLEWFDIVDAGADGSDEAEYPLVGC